MATNERPQMPWVLMSWVSIPVVALSPIFTFKGKFYIRSHPEIITTLQVSFTCLRTYNYFMLHKSLPDEGRKIHKNERQCYHHHCWQWHMVHAIWYLSCGLFLAEFMLDQRTLSTQVKQPDLSLNLTAVESRRLSSKIMLHLSASS